jgi:hypothetical protein
VTADRQKQPQKEGERERQQHQREQVDPRAAKWHALVQAATSWNSAHADLVAEFLKLTGGGCSGQNAGVSVRAVRQWQMDHGLHADGKIGKQTIEAARKEAGGHAGGGQQSDITFTDADAGSVESAGTEGGGSAEAAVGAGVVGQEEMRPTEHEDASAEGGGFVQEGVEKIGNDIAGEGHGAAVGAVARLALVPHIVNLLRAHRFKEAVDYVASSVGKEDLAEILKFVAEQVRGELSEHALELFEKAARLGLIYDVLKVGWEWTYGGIKAVQEAHEHGDQDSRIGIYAWAWADCVLKGSHDNPGAITEEQREAMQKGIQDGLATREQSPELPFLLLAEYGSESNARHALEDALYKRAGIDVRTHAGR